MSHSKCTKRNFSLYVNNRNKYSKKYINTCALCGKSGYSPAIEEHDFCITLERKAIYKELTKILNKMELDHLGRCADCARIQDEL